MKGLLESELDRRISFELEKKCAFYETKKMFGGMCFLVDGKMCVGSTKNRLMVRFDPSGHDKVMAMEGAMPMDFTSKVMKGFAFIAEDAIREDSELAKWIAMALEYNPRAKASKKTTRK